MKVKWLREHLAELNDDAAVTVWLQGALFNVGVTGTEKHDDAHAPRVVLMTGVAYRYGAAERS